MRLRITFSKTGALRYTGHLDLHKIWERTARRAALPLSYSKGFHPHPQIQLASALPLGFASRCEVTDIWIDGETDLTSLPEKLQATVPPGLEILQVEKVDDKAPALQTIVTSAEYEVTLLEPVADSELRRRLAAVIESPSLPRERRGKAYDLRPLIEDLRMLELDADGHPRLGMQLAARSGATGRPEEVLDALGISFEDTHILRTKLLFG